MNAQTGKRVFATVVALSLLLAGCANIPPPPAEVQRALAPSGKLRVGVYLGGPSSAVRDSNTGELKGVAHDLGKELARRLGVPFEPVRTNATPR